MYKVGDTVYLKCTNWVGKGVITRPHLLATDAWYIRVTADCPWGCAGGEVAFSACYITGKAETDPFLMQIEAYLTKELER